MDETSTIFSNTGTLLWLLFKGFSGKILDDWKITLEHGLEGLWLSHHITKKVKTCQSFTTHCEVETST